ncbi:MAG: TatD family hydrolase [Brevinematia bacterium]
MFVDTHFHLNMIEEDKERRKKIIDSMVNEGLSQGINIYTSPDAFLEDIEIIKYLNEKGFKVACGWYPEYSPSEERIRKLEEIIKNHNIFAIGEIGLEYYHMHKPKNEQIELFEMQLDLAQRYNKPVIIHSRDAFEDTFSTLKKYDLKMIIHCFSGTREIVKKYLDIGCFISFAGNLTFRKATDLHDSIKYVPLDRLFFETDAPFLAPVPLRGQKNYPYFVKHTYQFASSLLNLSFEYLVNKVYENWENLLK